ncbi:MAG TPA: Flp family type IVb pilin [Stellaceae bacterium]|nr:Flp family type IVb pilin [Stellaceae bacterium]
MRFAFRRPRLDRCGATAVEYAMIAFFVSIAAFSAIATIGTDVSGLFSQIASSF